MTPGSIPRRKFVRDTAAAGAAFSIVPRHVLGRGLVAPSDRLNVACIGVGGMGRNDVEGMSGENLVALCDVDWKRAEDAFESYPKATRYRDYRKMLEKEARRLDAVTVTIPDHSHAAATTLSLSMGLPTYTQKPLARTLGEVEAVMRAAKKAKVPTQMGNQGHANEGIRQIREWVEAGAIGEVSEVHYWTNRPIWPQGIERPLEAYNVPPTLDWDLWLGPAPERPYAPAYMPFRWRGWWDFGTGALGDMACHLMDAAFWTLDLGLPRRISAETTKPYTETAPEGSRITYEFDARGDRGPVTVVWRDGDLRPPRPAEYGDEDPWPPSPDGGQLWIGSAGKLLAGVYGEKPRLVDPERDRQLKADPPPQKYPRTGGVYAEFIEACKGGPAPGSTFDGYAGPLTKMVLLGNLSVRLGRAVELDGGEKVTNAEVPAGWLEPVYRKGWSY